MLLCNRIGKFFSIQNYRSELNIENVVCDKIEFLNSHGTVDVAVVDVVVGVVVVEVVAVDVVIEGVVEVNVAVSLVFDIVFKEVVGVEIEDAVDELWLSVEFASLILANEEIFVNAINVLKGVMVVFKEVSVITVAVAREFDTLKVVDDPFTGFKISARDDEDIAILV
jgi:hypothetical protein